METDAGYYITEEPAGVELIADTVEDNTSMMATSIARFVVYIKYYIVHKINIHWNN